MSQLLSVANILCPEPLCWGLLNSESCSLWVRLSSFYTFCPITIVVEVTIILGHSAILITTSACFKLPVSQWQKCLTLDLACLVSSRGELFQPANGSLITQQIGKLCGNISNGWQISCSCLTKHFLCPLCSILYYMMTITYNVYCRLIFITRSL